MKHRASPRFWEHYNSLPAQTQRLADACFVILKIDERHPSLHLKKAGRFWSVRIGIHYRALAVLEDDVLTWFWIGHHSTYDRLLGR